MSSPERGEPAKPVTGDPEQQEYWECAHCHTSNAVGVLFCEGCGYDVVTGTGAPEVEEDAPPPTRFQAGEPYQHYIDPDRDDEEIELPTLADAFELDEEADPLIRPDVPPPTPPAEFEPAHARPAHVPPSRLDPQGWVAEVWTDAAWYATTESDQPLPDAALPHVVPLTGTVILIGRAASGVGVRPDLDCGTDAGVSGRHAQLVTDGGRWWLEDLDTTNGTFVGPVDEPLPTEPLATGARVEVDDDDRIYLGGWTRIVLRRLPDRTR